MSDHSIIAIVVASMKRDLAVSVLGQSLAVLMNEHQFGFRGRGGVARLVFDQERYKWKENVSETFSSATDIDAEAIEELAECYRWFSISGSIRIPGRVRLYDLDLILYPTFDPANPVCIVFRIDSSLYHAVYGENDEFDQDADDEFDQDAADILLRLTVRLGAQDPVDGFQMLLVSSLADIKTFNGLTLRRSLLEPTPVQEVAKGAGLAHGFVTGIKVSLLSLAYIDRIKKIWADADKFETVNGFFVINDLIEIDESLFDDDEDESRIP